jgi:Cu(I)-responsive transcriptional regulator
MAFQPVNIGSAARLSGISTKMIRHYEEIGLMPKAARTTSGYRTYSETDIHTLRFIRQARDLGFSMKLIGELLSLWQNRRRPSSRVKALALGHIRELEEKIHEIDAMKAALEQLAAHCHGDDRPDCPILGNLAGADAAVAATARGERATADGMTATARRKRTRFR